MIDNLIRFGFVLVAAVAAELIIDQRHKLTSDAAQYDDGLPPEPESSDAVMVIDTEP